MNIFGKDKGKTCNITVDCIDCAISEPWPWESAFNRQFFLQKSKGAWLKYEVGVCIYTGDMVWVKGPFKAGKWNDIKLDKRSKTKARARHEKINAWLKICCALSSLFHNDCDLHQFVFHDVAVITQIFFENRSPSFSIVY
jgi:hypothetical protein